MTMLDNAALALEIVILACVTLLLFSAMWKMWGTKDLESDVEEGRWEVLPAHDAGNLIGFQIRWSVPDSEGRYLWVGHYFHGPDNSLLWCKVAADNHCKRLNDEGKLPYEYPSYNPS